MSELRDVPESYPVLGSATVYSSGRVIDVRSDEVRMPDGGTAQRDVVVHPGAVGVLALDDADRVLLVGQYRHPVRRRLWEPPAGLLDEPGEDPLSAARRELHEEAGYRARDWRVLVDAFTSPGMTDEAVRIYLARGLEPVGEHERHTGEHEESDLQLAWVDLDELVEAVLVGRVHNPLAVMGSLAAARARAAGFRDCRPADADWPELSPFTGSQGP